MIGSALADALAERGDEVVVLTRSARHAKGTIRYRQWDGKSPGAWVDDLRGARAVVNLSGEVVMQSWYGSGFKRVRDSRLDPTRAIGEAVAACGDEPPGYWLNSSAIGFYGDRGDEVLTEASGPGDWSDPLVHLVMDWEAAATSAADVPVGKCRTAVVLSAKGGALKALAIAGRSWIGGGQLGSGRQFMSWIHLDDLVAMMVRAIDERWEGPINASAPEPVRNRDFMSTLRRVVHRPWAPPVPAFLVTAIAKVTGVPLHQVLTSARVEPTVAVQAGFDFKYPTLEGALVAELSRR
ncbi:MAG: Epimerase family protein [Fimbriimonadaceae bacterium]|nr:Epimerase family protein [Fimbriimonadaceae bacterium]